MKMNRYTKTGKGKAKKYEYEVGDVKKNSVVKIINQKPGSSYKQFENQSLDVIDDLKRFFIAKSRKTGIVTTISKSDMHTKKISCKVVG